jgi:hypothetical protein
MPLVLGADCRADPVKKSQTVSGRNKELHMKNVMFASIAFALLTTAVSFAQDAKPSTPAGAQKTVTGCLQKGTQAGEVTLTATDGKVWDLSSDSVKLDEHIGHQVTVTGSATRETKAAEKKEGEVKNAAGKDEYGDLKITDLKMVSDSCTK